MSVNPPNLTIINRCYDIKTNLNFNNNNGTMSNHIPKYTVINSIDMLYKVIDKESIVKSIKAVIGDQDINLGCDDWYKGLGMDDLDQVEFIMNLEKECDLHINDDVADEVSKNGPKHLINNIVSIKREETINKILKR